jgi:hypothetical protein
MQRIKLAQKLIRPIRKVDRGIEQRATGRLPQSLSRRRQQSSIASRMRGREVCRWFGLEDACLAFTPAVVRSASCLYRCRVPRSLKALVMTDTELKLMASAAIIGESSHPVNG